jgi:hypothetical protein
MAEVTEFVETALTNADYEFTKVRRLVSSTEYRDLRLWPSRKRQVPEHLLLRRTAPRDALITVVREAGILVLRHLVDRAGLSATAYQVLTRLTREVRCG